MGFTYIDHINGGVIDRTEYEAENRMFAEFYSRVDSELVKFPPIGGLAVKLIQARTGAGLAKVVLHFN